MLKHPLCVNIACKNTLCNKKDFVHNISNLPMNYAKVLLPKMRTCLQTASDRLLKYRL